MYLLYEIGIVMSRVLLKNSASGTQRDEQAQS